MDQRALKHLKRAFDATYALLPRRRRVDPADALLVGHRGVWNHPVHRENTFEAFDLAVRCGGGLETDLRLSADGVPVVHHDPNLLRVHGVDASLAQTSAKELETLAPAVPTLAEFLRRYAGRCPHFFLELKELEPRETVEHLVRQAVQAIRDVGLTDTVTFLSLDPRPLDCVRELCPEIPRVHVFLLNPDRAAAYVKKHGDTGLFGWYYRFPQKLRPFLRSNGLLEGVGFVNYQNTLHAFLNRGYRILFTDRIDRLRPPPNFTA